MIVRAFFLLGCVVGLSIVATIYFGENVLVALGLIAVQAKLIWTKLLALKAPAIWAWLKSNLIVFLRKDIPSKWMSSVLLPLLLGKAIFRRMANVVAGYTAGVQAQFGRYRTWYRGQGAFLKVIFALILLGATVAMAVSVVGIWLILFSVGLPLWIAALLTTLGKSIFAGTQKYLFKLIAFLQLRWFGRALGRVLPAGWVAWKRKMDFRMARAVVRRRRMTIRQLAERKDRLPFRLGVMVEFMFAPSRGGDAALEKPAKGRDGPSDAGS